LDVKELTTPYQYPPHFVKGFRGKKNKKYPQIIREAEKKLLIISDNGFGISEVSEGSARG